MPAEGATSKEDGMILSGERKLAKAELDRHILQAAAGFESLGIGEDDAVAIMLRNDFAFFEAAMAAQLIGAYAVPVNWHYAGDEAAYIFQDCGAKVIVTHADLLPQIDGTVPEGTHLFVVETPPEIRDAYGLDRAACTVPEDHRRWDDFVAANEPWGGTPKAARQNMIYTSGTTGRPKGVRRFAPTPETAAGQAEMAAYVFDIRPGGKMRTVITGPMYHSAPNAYGLASARDGGFVVLQPRFDAEGLLRLIDEHRITHIHMVPTMFVRLLKLPEEVKRKYDLGSLKWVVHAAAPCPPHVKREMIEWWGPVIHEYYGSTETGANTFHNSEEALAKPGTVGREVPFGTVRILGENGEELPTGEIGDVYMRLNNAVNFTYHGREADRAEIETAGLITTGDMGYLDEDGYLFICDRRKDMVISGGVNIYPAEIEASLHRMPGVKDCAVFGIPDEEFGESLAAWIEPDPGADLSADAVKSWVREHLAGFKSPRVVEFSTDLPREDSGKIFKRKLREPYWADAGRSI